MGEGEEEWDEEEWDEECSDESCWDCATLRNQRQLDRHLIEFPRRQTGSRLDDGGGGQSEAYYVGRRQAAEASWAPSSIRQVRDSNVSARIAQQKRRPRLVRRPIDGSPQQSPAKQQTVEVLSRDGGATSPQLRSPVRRQHGADPKVAWRPFVRSPQAANQAVEQVAGRRTFGSARESPFR